MGYLKYQGYMGSVEYDEKEGCLYGHVQGMRDELLSYKGKSVAELEKKFKKGVDRSSLSCCHDGRMEGNNYKCVYKGSC